MFDIFFQNKIEFSGVAVKIIMANLFVFKLNLPK